uniref:LITAF domain-containing protein n=1 Tax=Anopheles minimus TaxID=112268 RepID=A0A182WP81_9DIPT
MDKQKAAVVNVTTALEVPATLGPDPARVVCPSCKAEVVTATKSQASNKTHIYSLVLFLMMCWPCCLIPYCCQSCKDTAHRCPNCNAFVGVFRH